MTPLFAASDAFWGYTSAVASVFLVQMTVVILAFIKYLSDQKENREATLLNRQATQEVGEKVKEVEIKVDGRVSEILRLAQENSLKDVKIAHAEGVQLGTSAEALRQSRLAPQTGAAGPTGATGATGETGETGAKGARGRQGDPGSPA